MIIKFPKTFLIKTNFNNEKSSNFNNIYYKFMHLSQIIGFLFT